MVAHDSPGGPGTAARLPCEPGSQKPIPPSSANDEVPARPSATLVKRPSARNHRRRRRSLCLKSKVTGLIAGALRHNAIARQELPSCSEGIAIDACIPRPPPRHEANTDDRPAVEWN